MQASHRRRREREGDFAAQPFHYSLPLFLSSLRNCARALSYSRAEQADFYLARASMQALYSSSPPLSLCSLILILTAVANGAAAAIFTWPTQN